MHPPITPVSIPVSTMPQLPRTVAKVTTEVDALFRSTLPFEDAMALALSKVEIAYAELHRLAAAAVPAPTRTVLVDVTARRVPALAVAA